MTNSQGGVKVPTGGNRVSVEWTNPRSPRALLATLIVAFARRTADSVRFRGRQLKSGYENEGITKATCTVVMASILVALLFNSAIGKQQMNTFNANFSDTTARPRIAFVQSCWHRDIVDQLRDSFLKTHAELDNRSVDVFEVPGAFEIPLRTKILACSGQYAGIVAAGLIVDGGIYRHEFVSTAVIDGLMGVQLETGVPVFSAVLTPQDFLSDGQPEFFHEHFVSKGVEAAHACVQTISALKQEQVA